MTTRSGYAVTIRGFIPVDPSDLDQHAMVIEAIREARTPLGDPDNGAGPNQMFSIMEVETFDVKPVTRRAKDGGVGE